MASALRRATDIPASRDVSLDAARLGFFGRMVAALCAILVFAPVLVSAGLHGQIATTFIPPAEISATVELSAEDPAQLAAILGWRQVAGVEAKRTLPEGPPKVAPPVQKQPAAPGLFVALGRVAHWQAPTVHAGLLDSNRAPTGPPIP